MLISNTALYLLEWLAQGGDDEYGYPRELVRDKGVWMKGVFRANTKTVNELIQLCLIKTTQFQETGLEYWEINEEGRNMLRDPENYQPQICNFL